jgi:hypothetical protein
LLATDFSPEHIQAAREKCGNFPATRNALKSDCIRHKIVEGEDGDSDEEEVDAGSYLVYPDARQVRSTKSSHGRYIGQKILADTGKRKVMRITERQTVGRATARIVKGKIF